MDDLKYCSACGFPIPIDAWVVDEKSDREHPSYLHLGCFPGGYYQNETQPSADGGSSGEDTQVSFMRKFLSSSLR